MYVPSYELFRTNQERPHCRDSPPDILGCLGASDRKPLRPTEEHVRTFVTKIKTEAFCFSIFSWSHLLPCPHVHQFDLLTAGERLIGPPPPLPLAPVHKKLKTKGEDVISSVRLILTVRTVQSHAVLKRGSGTSSMSPSTS